MKDLVMKKKIGNALDKTQLFILMGLWECFLFISKKNKSSNDD